MIIRNHLARKPPLGVQIVLIILLKILILTGIWYALIRDRKIDGSPQGTATYFLTDGAKPQPKTQPGSIWH